MAHRATSMGRRPALLPLFAALALALGVLHFAAPRAGGDAAPPSPTAAPAPASLADALFRRGGRRFLRKRLQEGRDSWNEEDRKRPRRHVARRSRGGGRAVRRSGRGRRM
uniref:Uncharacterized protein n=1 Tax=Alexandrium monilatum TaxID=311494 RepID=A0A7S4Q7C1_9DINO